MAAEGIATLSEWRESPRAQKAAEGIQRFDEKRHKEAHALTGQRKVLRSIVEDPADPRAQMAAEGTKQDAETTHALEAAEGLGRLKQRKIQGVLRAHTAAEGYKTSNKTAEESTRFKTAEDSCGRFAKIQARRTEGNPRAQIAAEDVERLNKKIQKKTHALTWQRKLRKGDKASFRDAKSPRAQIAAEGFEQSLPRTQGTHALIQLRKTRTLSCTRKAQLAPDGHEQPFTRCRAFTVAPLTKCWYSIAMIGPVSRSHRSLNARRLSICHKVTSTFDVF
ncbi:hypothetical protein EJ05DRAFT_488301 [Pseudovirgaria hyperparasitica]|uniref:Uncharacterized protein n=1 Tax=Pseudovirgaria hyperparasitica TaxID=470096 RepID=A0A6A6W0P4_9PEZI|nr:uncharacterized protein EJ05DRAFT_488301 [Pseudovirgaria hyperparasitica]KAF2755554.1 hypothetical protein EJ05DRAFT_488301 [Pseudovirgaria hyperparasitica]